MKSRHLQTYFMLKTIKRSHKETRWLGLSIFDLRQSDKSQWTKTKVRMTEDGNVSISMNRQVSFIILFHFKEIVNEQDEKQYAQQTTLTVEWTPIWRHYVELKSIIISNDQHFKRWPNGLIWRNCLFHFFCRWCFVLPDFFFVCFISLQFNETIMQVDVCDCVMRQFIEQSVASIQTFPSSICQCKETTKLNAHAHSRSRANERKEVPRNTEYLESCLAQAIYQSNSQRDARWELSSTSFFFWARIQIFFSVELLHFSCHFRNHFFRTSI